MDIDMNKASVFSAHVQHQGPVTHLTLNRPDKLNAVSAMLIEELLSGFSEAEERGSQLVVFTGEGKSFSAGFDLSGLDQQSDAELVLRFIRVETLLQKIYAAPMTTMALAHGRCFGAAADIFSACSRRIAAPATTFQMPGLRFGVVLGTRRLARLVGTDNAREILESTRVFSIEDGLAMNFVQLQAEQDSWPSVIETATEAAQVLNSPAKLRMLRNTREDLADLDRDMAELVRSASVPGLVDRIRNFVNAINQKSRSA